MRLLSIEALKKCFSQLYMYLQSLATQFFPASTMIIAELLLHTEAELGMVHACLLRGPVRPGLTELILGNQAQLLHALHRSASLLHVPVHVASIMYAVSSKPVHDKHTDIHRQAS